MIYHTPRTIRHGLQLFTVLVVRNLKLQKPNTTVPSTLERMKYRLGFHGNLKNSPTQLRLSGERLYVACAEYPVFEEFVEHLGLPDTFQSWFSLTTLHMWMCLVRLRQETVEGQLMKRSFINVLWMDLHSRMYTFKIYRRRHRQVMGFRNLFYGSIIAYDEGFLSNSDAIFVTALWRNLFVSSDSVTGQQLELALNYTRKNLCYLNRIPSDKFLEYGTPAFIPLLSDKTDREFAAKRLEYCYSWPEFAV